ncbi:MAG: hypothetical protein WCC90_17685 [Methylocella sp.]
MKRKVAVDEDISRRVASTLNVAYGDKGYEFIYIVDLVGHGAKDEFWAERFGKFGGEIILSADKNIAKKPRKLLAFRENELICFFMQPLWSNRPGHYKLCHALYWWHWIHKKLHECQKRDCWQVPLVLTGNEFKRLEIPAHVLEAAQSQMTA